MASLIVSDVGERPFVSRSKAIGHKKGQARPFAVAANIQSADRSEGRLSPKWVKIRWGWLGITIFSCLVLTSRATAASFDFNETSWEGSSELLHLARSRFGSERVRLVATIDFASLTPGDGLLIVHPTVTLPTDAYNVFMLSGGRIAILDDFGSSGPFLERFGIRRTNPPLRPAKALRGNHNLAWAEPIRSSGEGQVESFHSMVVGIGRVLTNHPTTFVNPGLTPVLEIRASDGATYPLAISGVIGQRGRLFAMGDPSVVINLMLRYPENRQFAERLLDYLVEDDTWGARKGKLYLVANEFSQQHLGGNPLSPRILANQLRDAGNNWVKWRIPEFAAWILGLMAALAIGREAWQRIGQKASVYRPRFAQPVPLVSQPGEQGRAAVLAAPSTPHGLVLLELMAGIAAYLTAHLDLDEQLGMAAIFDAAFENQLVNPAQREKLRALTAVVNRVQTSLISGGRTRVSQNELSQAHLLMLDIRRTIDHRQRQ
jgi:hypothetical protein